MLDFRRLTDTFSRRPKKSQAISKKLTQAFKHRVVMLCMETFPISAIPDGFQVSGQEFWPDINRRLRFLYGRPSLSADPAVRSPADDTLRFLGSCPDDHFLDFLEAVFRTECYWRIRTDENYLVDQFNEMFLYDDLPYALTRFVRETLTESARQESIIVCYPKVIRRDEDYTHERIIVPALTALSQAGFSSASVEFLDALEEYRKGDYGDAVTKCASALESTIKYICERNRWPYDKTASASQLVKIVIKHGKLEPLFDTVLLSSATLRNNLSKSHGSGTELRAISASKAEYSINLAAAAILFLAREVG